MGKLVSLVSRFILYVQQTKSHLYDKISSKVCKEYLKRQGCVCPDFKKLQINGRPVLQIHPESSLVFGKEVIINSGNVRCFDNGLCSKIVLCKNARLQIGDFSGISNTLIYCKKSISIGNHVNIGAGTLIFDSNFHSTNWEDRIDRHVDIKNAKNSPIIIEDLVFIGARCIIGKGVTIGKHSIIAAGSVVVNDIPADCIAGGNPCRVIKVLNQ